MFGCIITDYYICITKPKDTNNMKRKISLVMIFLGMLIATTVEKEDSIVPQMAGVSMMLIGVALQDNSNNSNSDKSEDESRSKS